MEEMTIWEQHTVTLSKDSKVGFGFAVSGGLDKPVNGDTAVVVSDVLPSGPAMGRLQTRDQIVMVNGVSMEKVTSLYTIQNLRNCGKTANITVKRPRTIQIPASNRPTRSVSQSNILDDDMPQGRGQRNTDTSRNRRTRSVTPDRNGHDLPIMSGFKRLPNQDVQDKPHPLLDITPTAVERLNYIQYHPMVLFLDPHSRKDVKSMRQKYMPGSNKSSRRLYAQALKLRKHYSHLFSARIDLQPNTNMWYDVLKDKIRQQQSKPVWVSEVALEGGGDEDLDAFNRENNSDYLSGASDYEDTDGEAITDGEAYTDNEDLEEPSVGIARNRGTALARSSEPATGQIHSPEPSYDPEPYLEEEPEYTLTPGEIPPILHVPEPRSPRFVPGSPQQQDDVPSQRSFSDSDFSAGDLAAPPAPSDVPPNFRAPDPKEVQSETPPLSAIEEKLQQARMAEPERKPSPSFIVLAHHEAMQMRRTQIRGSDSDSDEDDRDDYFSVDDDETDDIEWGPATEL
uniref:Tight junction protein 3 n=1 Tax=Sinocyclocheilus grahami TaxID=75366 RepID=A0A672T2T0_SINGR